MLGAVNRDAAPGYQWKAIFIRLGNYSNKTAAKASIATAIVGKYSGPRATLCPPSSSATAETLRKTPAEISGAEAA